MNDIMTKHHKQNRTFLEVLVLGIGRALWWLICLPFRGKKKERLSAEDRSYIIEKRHEIEELQKSDKMIELKHAVLEADKLVDFILKKRGYRGETFAERLRSAEDYLDHRVYQDIWDGHKIRNQIAHDNINISQEILRSSVKKLLGYK